MEPPGGIEPRAFHLTLRMGLEDPCEGRGHYFMVDPLGIEPSWLVLQTSAMTTLAQDPYFLFSLDDSISFIFLSIITICSSLMNPVLSAFVLYKYFL